MLIWQGSGRSSYGPFSAVQKDNEEFYEPHHSR